EDVAELGLEALGVLDGGEVAAETLTGFADRVRDAIDELLDAALAAVRVAVDAGLAEVLGGGDVAGELGPIGGDFQAAQLENDRTVRVRDDAVALRVRNDVERVHARTRINSRKFQTFRFSRAL